MKLGSRQMSLLVYDEGATPRRLLVSVHINTAQFFNNFSVDGISSSNEIFLEFPTDMLSSSLSSLRQTNTNVKCVEILLTEQNSSPCLTFKMEFVSEFAMTRWCVHDIPVTVVPCNEWSRYHEPVEKTYTVSLEINNLKKLRSVVESLKRISQHVNIIGSTESLLSLHAQSQSATVKVIFKNIYQIQVSGKREHRNNARLARH
ncbi:hypothetical protein AAG570_008787 [Ranatra chinensis]|uniref:Checkpoint protein n=1 Tax=Ranatra chinensis TaxID=642074 RepID=A0ABD0YRX1_9HEMI